MKSDQPILDAIHAFRRLADVNFQGKPLSAELHQLADNLGKYLIYSSWQPIETAPKDGIRLLYLAQFNEHGQLISLDFDGIWQEFQDPYEEGGAIHYDWAGAYGTVCEPTHWAYQDEPIPTTSKEALATELEPIEILAQASVAKPKNWSLVSPGEIEGKRRELAFEFEVGLDDPAVQAALTK